MSGVGSGAPPLSSRRTGGNVETVEILAFEHHAEHRRHEETVGDLVLFNQLQAFAGAEVAHDDRGAAKVDLQLREIARRGVPEVAGIEGDLVGTEIVLQRLVEITHGDGAVTDDGRLGPAGGAGGVAKVQRRFRRHRHIGGNRPATGKDTLVIVLPAGIVIENDHVPVDARAQILIDPVEQRHELRFYEDAGHLGVLEAHRDLTCAQPMVDRHHANPGESERERDFQVAVAVARQHGHALALGKAARLERVDEPLNALVQLPVGPAPALENNRGAVRIAGRGVRKRLPNDH